MTRQIGEGAMGVVWAAVNESTGREVALKLILRSTDHLRQRLRREARTTGKLQHRNAIEILDMGETAEGDPFLVMPLLTGETLRARMTREGRLEPLVAARIGRDVARALAAAHAAGVIHRDLKPANIFLHQEADADNGPVVKVLDFGVSKDLNPIDGIATMGGGIVGSLAYMSPEQAKVDRSLDHRADLWSLGVILFEMLAGVRPFKGSAQDILPQLFFDEIPRLDGVVRGMDPVLSELVARCLQRDRDQRISSAAEVASLLQRFVHPSQERISMRHPIADPFTPPLPGGSGSAPAPHHPPPRAAFASNPEISQAGYSAHRNSAHPLPVLGDEEDLDDSHALTVRLDEKMTAALRGYPPQAPPGVEERFNATVPMNQVAQRHANAAIPSPPPPVNRASPAPARQSAPPLAAAPSAMPWQPHRGGMGTVKMSTDFAAQYPSTPFPAAPLPSAPALAPPEPPRAPTFDPMMISSPRLSAPPSRKQLGVAMGVGFGLGVLGLLVIVLYTVLMTGRSPTELPEPSPSATSAPGASPSR